MCEDCSCEEPQDGEGFEWPRRYPIFLQNQQFEVIDSDPDDWTWDGMGRSNPMRLRILIRADMPLTQKLAVTVHEVVHMMADANALSFAGDEKEVSIMANCVFDFIVNNPHFIELLFAVYQSGGSGDEGDGGSGDECRPMGFALEAIQPESTAVH